MVIRTYEDAYAAAFARLNREWLERYDLLETGDLKYLEHPRESIIEAGGEIFVALEGRRVVGTCAAIYRGEGSFELAKLAVDREVRGRGIGRQLVEAVMAWTRARGARSVTLLSSTKLTAALRLYERLGFVYRPLPADPRYETADIHMEYVL